MGGRGGYSGGAALLGGQGGHLGWLGPYHQRRTLPILEGPHPFTSTLARAPASLSSLTVPPPHSQAQASCPRLACPTDLPVAVSPLGWQSVFSKWKISAPISPPLSPFLHD